MTKRRKVLTKKECLEWLKANGYDVEIHPKSRLFYISKKGSPLFLYASLPIVRYSIRKAIEEASDDE